MENSQLTELTTAFNSEVLAEDEGLQFLTLTVESNMFLPLANFLRETPELNFDFLFCLTAVDMEEYFLSVYHFRSTNFDHELVVKAKIEKENPEIHTVSHIWKTAEFHEREAYDLMGIKFINHPDLRRIFLEDDWVGYPLRKDYVDEVNIVEL